MTCQNIQHTRFRGVRGAANECLACEYERVRDVMKEAAASLRSLQKYLDISHNSGHWHGVNAYETLVEELRND